MPDKRSADLSRHLKNLRSRGCCALSRCVSALSSLYRPVPLPCVSKWTGLHGHIHVCVGCIIVANRLLVLGKKVKADENREKRKGRNKTASQGKKGSQTGEKERREESITPEKITEKSTVQQVRKSRVHERTYTWCGVHAYLAQAKLVASLKHSSLA